MLIFLTGVMVGCLFWIVLTLFDIRDLLREMKSEKEETDD